MTPVRALGLSGVLTALVVAFPSTTFAQSNDEVFPQLQWNFSTPGARANAMGRAFIGVADDASAAVTNPAGLLRLTKPQVYFEFKSTDIKVPRLADSESLFTVAPTEFSQVVDMPSFLSASFPVGNRLAFGFTRHEFLDYQETFNLSARPIPGDPLVDLFNPVNGSSQFTGVAYAGSAAFKVSDHLQIGVTVSSNHLSATSQATRFNFLTSNTADYFSDTASSIIKNQTAIDGTSSAVGATLGLLWEASDGKLSAGFQYTKGPSFQVGETLAVNEGAGANPPTQLPLVPYQGAPFLGGPVTVHIHVPNRAGLGVAFRPGDRLLIAADAVYIGYSSLAQDFTLVFPGTSLTASEFSVPNVVEAHAGVEYLLTNSAAHRVFVRAGVFTDPDHTTRFCGCASNTTDNAVATAQYNLLPKTTAIYGTAGIGFVFGQRFQADIAFVGTPELVASLGVRF
jgi:long-chain fatty acid transport protein